jgi:N-acetylglucosamine-6-phosphate deacetylase
MIIKNALVYKEEEGFVAEDIYIDDDKIVENYKASDQILDAEGLYAIPGLTDIHFHGCAGHDFCDGTHEALESIAIYQATNGITTICPTSMTLEEKELNKLYRFASAYENKAGAILSGIHMEGPFINSEKKGAQNEKYIYRPDIQMFHRLQKASGNLIRIVSIAPEVEGAMEFISQLKDEVTISIAHTQADYDTTMDAIRYGAKQITHLFNAMPPFNHRDPAVIGAAFDSQDVYAELITDGIHIHPSMVRAAFKLFGADRIILISDSMMAAGMPDGDYSLGGQAVSVRGNRAVLSDGTIAGSVTNLMECMKISVLNMGIPLEDAVRCAAVNPAKAIGIYDTYGSITPGKVANIVLLDKDLNIKSVIVKGCNYNFLQG